MNTNYKRGFTLIELLVVIAIIGILAAVVLTSLGSARGKARTASVQETMHGIQAAASICENDGIAVNIPTNTQNGGGGAICTGSSATYGALPTGWVYCSGAACSTSSSTAISVQSTGQSFRIVASSDTANDNKTVFCTDTACYTN